MMGTLNVVFFYRERWAVLKSLLVAFVCLLSSCKQSATTSGGDVAEDKILSGYSAKNSAGVTVKGTMVNRGAWDLSKSFPGVGYYSSISNLPSASNIVSGTTILGVAGSLVTTNRGAWDLRATFPGAGQYSSVSHAPTASQLCSSATGGQAFNGTTGTAICEIGTGTGSDAGASNILSGSSAWNSSGTVVNGTMVSRGTWNLQSTFPGAGYYGAVSNLPTTSQIVTGNTVLGVSGSASFPDFANSTAFRDKNTSTITIRQETTTYAGAALPSNFRDVPIISKDDDGFVNAGVTSPQFTAATRPSVTCGATQNTVASRIADCASKNGANASWDGSVNANGGQGIWKLVTRAATNKEVWQDMRTNLLWTSIMSVSDNWCRAAGNAEASSAYSYCNTTSPQPDYPIAQSWCAEVGPTTMKEVSGSGEDWASGTYATAKGGMGKTATSTSPSIRWRLPTMHDFNLAEVDGIRFVMPDMVPMSGFWEWTATIGIIGIADFVAVLGSPAGYIWYAAADSFHSGKLRCVGR